MGMLGKDLPSGYAGKNIMDITHGVKLGCLYKKNPLCSQKLAYLLQKFPFFGIWCTRSLNKKEVIKIVVLLQCIMICVKE